jgi:hypothetical protein
MNEGDNNLETPPPEESSNRTFFIIAGILGGIVLLSLACFAAYALFFAPSRAASQAQAATAQAVQNLQVAQALTATSQALLVPSATATLPPTQTPVVAQATATAIPPTNTPDPATATVAAALTQAAAAQLTHVPTSTALPGTGIADQYGVPGLVVMGMALVAVIFLARRLRFGQSR